MFTPEPLAPGVSIPTICSFINSLGSGGILFVSENALGMGINEVVSSIPIAK